MTITLAWWMLPTAITLIAFATALFWPSDSGGGGWMPDLTPLLLMIPALFVSLVAWIVYAVMK